MYNSLQIYGGHLLVIFSIYFFEVIFNPENDDTYESHYGVFQVFYLFIFLFEKFFVALLINSTCVKTCIIS